MNLDPELLVGSVLTQDNLRTRFAALWRRTVAGGKDTDPPYEELFTRYSEPHRSYHSLKHINHCLSQIDIARDGIPDVDAVEMAVWFHDVIYDPYAADNEQRSADLFDELSRGASSEFRAKVRDLIMVTVHPTEPADIDQQYMVDIDLSGFGMPWKEFNADSEAVRREYLHLPSEDFQRGQLKFFKLLLDRQNFYHTEFFRSRYEETARANIKRQIANPH